MSSMAIASRFRIVGHSSRTLEGLERSCDALWPQALLSSVMNSRRFCRTWGFLPEAGATNDSHGVRRVARRRDRTTIAQSGCGGRLLRCGISDPYFVSSGSPMFSKSSVLHPVKWRLYEQKRSAISATTALELYVRRWVQWTTGGLMLPRAVPTNDEPPSASTRSADITRTKWRLYFTLGRRKVVVV